MKSHKINKIPLTEVSMLVRFESAASIVELEFNILIQKITFFRFVIVLYSLICIQKYQCPVVLKKVVRICQTATHSVREKMKAVTLQNSDN